MAPPPMKSPRLQDTGTRGRNVFCSGRVANGTILLVKEGRTRQGATIHDFGFISVTVGQTCPLRGQGDSISYSNQNCKILNISLYIK